MTPGARQKPPSRRRPSRELRGGRLHVRTVGGTLAVLAVLVIAANLRLGAAVPGPLLTQITATLGAGEVAGGLVTALPGLCFGVLGLLAVPFGRRAGLTGAIVAAFAVTAAGLLLRPLVGSTAAFLGLTVLGLAGPAVGNVLVPAWVKRHGQTRGVLLMTVYTVLLAIGSAAGSLLAVPLAGTDPDGWRRALEITGAVALVPVAVWLLVLRRTGHDYPPPPPAGHAPGSLLRSPTALALTATFGLQSMTAYVQLGWLPRVYADAGLSASTAGALTALIGALGLVGGLLMPTVVARSRRPQPIVLLLGLITAAGYVGLVLAPREGALAWAILLGVGGWTFQTLLALIPARSEHPAVTARLSGMVQPVGYFLAALGPFSVGILHDVLGSWSAIVAGLAALAVVMGVVGARAAAPRLVDDELRR